MKKLISVCCILLFAVVLVACGTDFDGSRTGNDRQFVMEFTTLNTVDLQDLQLEAGESIHAKLVVDGGKLAVEIQKGDETPIFTGDGITASQEFQVDIDEGGIYTVMVTGEKAAGSVSFIAE